jgi:hypothetical protein
MADCNVTVSHHIIDNLINEHGRIRTCDPQDRNLILYPLSYMPSLMPMSNLDLVILAHSQRKR